jgi:quaternary ammonium compound-resistance protein SugE
MILRSQDLFGNVLGDQQMPWLFIVFADIFEISWPFLLKSAREYSKWSPIWVAQVGIPIMFILDEALKRLPAATVYATFAGIATAGTAFIGVVFFGESVNFGRICSFLLLIMGLVGLHFFSDAD